MLIYCQLIFWQKLKWELLAVHLNVYWYCSAHKIRIITANAVSTFHIYCNCIHRVEVIYHCEGRYSTLRNMQCLQCVACSLICNKQCLRAKLSSALVLCAFRVVLDVIIARWDSDYENKYSSKGCIRKLGWLGLGYVGDY